MKKLLSLLLAGLLLATTMVSCGGTTPAETTPAATTTAPVTTEAPDPGPQPPFSLDGKTFIFLGSSVTYGSASNGWSMADYIAENNDCTVHKWAKSGTTLVDNGADSYVQRMLNTLKRVRKCDHFIVQLSTNDATQNKPLGKLSDSMNKEDFDTSTIMGAIEFIIATAKETYGCEVSFYTGTRYNSTAYQNMINALYQIAKKWDIGIIDLWADREMNKVSAADRQRYMSDDIHPTRVGYEEWWGPKFQEHLEQYQ